MAISINDKECPRIYNIPKEKCDCCALVRGKTCANDGDTRCYYKKASSFKLFLRKILK